MPTWVVRSVVSLEHCLLHGTVHKRSRPTPLRPIQGPRGIAYGCTAQTLNEWVKKADVDSGRRPGVTSDERERLKALERENRELRQANEILRKASAYFAQAELDRRWKP
jgi:transposase